MKTSVKSFSMSKVSLGLVATVLVFQINSAAAHVTEEVLEKIVVETPAVVTRNIRMGRGQEQFQVQELRQSISYSDLDLTLHKDVAELKGRIETAAQEICKKLTELAEKSPRFRNPETTCIRNAVDSATEKFDVIVAAANS